MEFVLVVVDGYAVLAPRMEPRRGNVPGALLFYDPDSHVKCW